MLQERRRALHARIVEALERLHEHDWTSTSKRSPTTRSWVKCGTRPCATCDMPGRGRARQSANREAVTHLERALIALRRLPDSASRAADDIDVRLELRLALLPLGDMRATFVHLHAAEELASAIGDDRRLGWILAYLTVYLSGEGGVRTKRSRAADGRSRWARRRETTVWR